MAGKLWAVISYAFVWNSVLGKISFHDSYDCASQCVLQRFELKVVTVMVHQGKVIASI